MLRVPKTVFTVVSPLQTLVGDRLGCTPAFDGAKFLIETLSLGLGWRVPLRPPSATFPARPTKDVFFYSWLERGSGERRHVTEGSHRCRLQHKQKLLPKPDNVAELLNFLRLFLLLIGLFPSLR